MKAKTIALLTAAVFCATFCRIEEGWVTTRPTFGAVSFERLKTKLLAIVELQLKGVQIVSERKEGPEVTPWSAGVSLPFPKHWPPTGEPQVVFYSYGRRHDFSVRDAEERTEIFGIIEADIKGEALSSEITKKKPKSHLLGVRPVGPQKILTTDEETWTQLAMTVSSKGVPKPNQYLSAAYCLWLSGSGLKADMTARHRQFLEWLNCEKN